MTVNITSQDFRDVEMRFNHHEADVLVVGAGGIWLCDGLCDGQPGKECHSLGAADEGAGPYYREGLTDEPYAMLGGILHRPSLLAYHFFAVAFLSVWMNAIDVWKGQQMIPCAITTGIGRCCSMRKTLLDRVSDWTSFDLTNTDSFATSHSSHND